LKFDNLLQILVFFNWDIFFLLDLTYGTLLTLQTSKLYFYWNYKNTNSIISNKVE